MEKWCLTLPWRIFIICNFALAMSVRHTNSNRESSSKMQSICYCPDCKTQYCTPYHKTIQNLKEILGWNFFVEEQKRLVTKKNEVRAFSTTNFELFKLALLLFLFFQQHTRLISFNEDFTFEIWIKFCNSFCTLQ